MNEELKSRQQIERDYYNKIYMVENASEHARTGGTAYEFFQRMIDQLPLGRILDFGSGDGWVSISMAQKGYDVYGIDISIELVNKSSNWAEELGISHKAHFEEMTGEDLKFQDNFFDAVIGSAVLHHTDIKLALNNIYRVLKSGGKGLFIEPMNQNLILKIWRLLTPWRRSPAERALTLKEIGMVMHRFPKARLYYFNLAAIFSIGLIALSPKNRLVQKLNMALEKFDRVLLKLFPKLNIYCAVVVIELVKE
jgi:2-polyprenyl-3-methyl-5-hydroxy-6-metoxy-1,4-benzoquinol methylase